MDITVIYGGKSGEHEISLVSASAVARNIREDNNVTLISVSKEGRWYLEDDSLTTKLRNDSNFVLSVTQDESKRVSIIPGGGKEGTFFCNGKTIRTDVVIPVMHGPYGEDGTIQGLLEMADVPYVGCRVASSAITMDKEFTKILWQESGLPVVPYVCLTKSDVNNSSVYDGKIKRAIDTLKFPLFVKPCSAGSSDGAGKACDEKQLNLALMDAFLWDNKVLIEKAIDAREVECSVTGNSVTMDPSSKDTVITSYGPGEIVPKHIFYDYDAKYNDPDGAELKIPADLTQDKIAYIKETARKAYSAVNAAGLSRVDFFIDRSNGTIYLNEINTMPGFTSISMFPKLCQSEGLDFTSLIDLLCNEAVCNYNAQSSLKTSRS